MEILKKEQYPEYEEFCKSHPQGGFTQSTLWYGVKNNWGHEIVVSRNETGEIVGGMSVLIQILNFRKAMQLLQPGILME